MAAWPRPGSQRVRTCLLHATAGGCRHPHWAPSILIHCSWGIVGVRLFAFTLGTLASTLGSTSGCFLAGGTTHNAYRDAPVRHPRTTSTVVPFLLRVHVILLSILCMWCVQVAGSVWRLWGRARGPQVMGARVHTLPLRVACMQLMK
jgi:hypothetical protein